MTLVDGSGTYSPKGRFPRRVLSRPCATPYRTVFLPSLVLISVSTSSWGASSQ